MTRLIVALDTADRGQAQAWAAAVAPHAGMVKVGLELFLSHGASFVQSLAGPVFLDLKLHDIPNTVAGAVIAVRPLAPAMLTVHAAGGGAMLEAACRGVEGSPTQLLAVTVLTSLDAETLHATGVAGGTRQQALRLARLALSAGAHGLVCSPHEVAMLRDALGDGPVLVVPGIRPSGSPDGDQARTMTPRAAVDAGADWIVVGRPITGAADPGAAAAAIVRDIQGL